MEQIWALGFLVVPFLQKILSPAFFIFFEVQRGLRCIPVILGLPFSQCSKPAAITILIIPPASQMAWIYLARCEVISLGSVDGLPLFTSPQTFSLQIVSNNP